MTQLVNVTVQDLTSPGTFTPTQFYNLVWSLWYQGVYQYNRSAWVEHGYAAGIADVRPIEAGTAPPAGAWHIELLDTSTEPGALGWHEDQAHTSSAHSMRGLAAGTETPLSKVFCLTSREDGIQPTEVASHEMLEMLVDPYVMNEADIRKYLNPATHQWYIGEVGDPVQGEGYDVGDPEGRPCGVPEAIVANFAEPGWWGQEQTRPELDFRKTRQSAFEIAPEGYMSVAPEASPTEWSQIYGSAKQKAEARAHAFERPGEVG